MYSNLNIPTRKLNSYRGYAFPKTDKKEMKKILNLSIRDGKVFLFSLISFCVLSSFTSDIFYDALASPSLSSHKRHLSATNRRIDPIKYIKETHKTNRV